MIGVVDINLIIFKAINDSTYFGQLRVIPKVQVVRTINNSYDKTHLEKRTQFFANGCHNNLLVLYQWDSTTIF